MFAVATLLIGIVIGFIAGWLVRDARERRLIPPGEPFGLGVPDAATIAAARPPSGARSEL